MGSSESFNQFEGAITNHSNQSPQLSAFSIEKNAHLMHHRLDLSSMSGITTDQEARQSQYDARLTSAERRSSSVSS